MKSYIAIFLLLAWGTFCKAKYTLTEEDQKYHDEHHDQCQEVTNVNRELVENAYKGDFANDPQLKHQMYCVGIRFGFISEDGVVDKDKIRERMAKEGEKNIDAILNDCIKDFNGDDKHDQVMEAAKCWYSKSSLVVPL